MAKKRRYETIKPGKRGTTGILIVLIVVVVIITTGAFGIIQVINAAVNNVEASSGIIIQPQVNGDDLIIHIVGGDRVDQLESLFVEISGYDYLSSGIEKPVEKGQTEVIYEGLLNGITGFHQIAVRGLFNDGKKATITIIEMRLT